MSNASCVGSTLPERNQLQIPAATPYFVAAGTNTNITAIMTSCCEPNPVQLVDPGCYRWCEVPASYLKDKPSQAGLEDALSGCIARYKGGEIISGAGVTSDAARGGPTVFHLTYLVVVASIIRAFYVS